MVGGLGATIVGTPEHVADEFERWVEEGDVSQDVHEQTVALLAAGGMQCYLFHCLA